MVVRPLAWVSWSVARFRMPEIWGGWSYLSDRADKAMVNSLRRGNVPYRGEARELGSPWPVLLNEVVAGLLSLGAGSLAEYEKTEWTAGVAIGRLPLHTPPRPIARKATADVSGAELAWEEFRDDLIRFELPAGTMPKPMQRQKPAVDGKFKLTKLANVRVFFDENYPEGIPAGLSDKAIARLVSDYAKVQISERTVRRARSE
jgi:hypothetical protein